jgi:tetratricopeptide (TPR) repeat protein
MEGIILLIIFFAYIVLRLAFGMQKNQSDEDRKAFYKGLNAIKHQDWPFALAYFEGALQQNPKSAVALAARAKCHLALDEPLFAAADAEKASTIDPYIAEAYITKAKALIELGVPEAAILELDKAVWFDRHNTEPLLLRASLHDVAKQPTKAIADLKAAATMGDEHANFLLQRMLTKSWAERNNKHR